MNSHHSSLSPNSSNLKARFTLRFLRALKRLNRQPLSPPPPKTVSSPREMCRRYLKIRIAADASMASAVGSRRAWSRALLLKIRSRQCRSSSLSTRRVGMKAKSVGEKMKKKKLKYCKEMTELQKFVPGGDAMDACSLMDEAAHYIRCLNTQVKVMTMIADLYSAN
ncbi:transcription factor IBH1-like [Argentina anserina]|uniref:transcription factor IBH1-like n=1 Tax=Argentina anserina TaxID=57926 RepID=UPI002176371F|nr:transcription factor IBH1-like [Potentilla anserina]